jgi:hypothetical protein
MGFVGKQGVAFQSQSTPKTVVGTQGIALLHHQYIDNP